MSENGQKRYTNACIVYHDPAESHPFHTRFEDGTMMWLAVVEDSACVHSINAKTRRRVTRSFTWTTPERGSSARAASVGAAIAASAGRGVGVGDRSATRGGLKP